MHSSYLTSHLYRSMKSSFVWYFILCSYKGRLQKLSIPKKSKLQLFRTLLCVRRLPWWHARCTYRNAQRRRDTAVCFCQLRAASDATIRICHAVSTGRLFFSSWHGGQLRCHWSGTHWVRTWWCWQVHPTILSLRLVHTIFLLGSSVVAWFRASAQGWADKREPPSQKVWEQDCLQHLTNSVNSNAHISSLHSGLCWTFLQPEVPRLLRPVQRQVSG